MKFAMFVLLCCVVAFAAAAPQFLTTYPGYAGYTGYAGYVAPYAPLATRTVVAGPTVVNGAWGTRYVAPGYVGTTLF